jgi:hypothetical protein
MHYRDGRCRWWTRNISSGSRPWRACEALILLFSKPTMRVMVDGRRLGMRNYGIVACTDCIGNVEKRAIAA